MKKYIKPDSKLINLASHGYYADIELVDGSVLSGGDDPVKGTSDWETEEEISEDDGFGW